MNKKKYCLIYNYHQHYREAIFKKMDDELDVDFYFGDNLDWAPDIKGMDYTRLKGFKAILKNRKILKYFIWQDGALGLAFKKYNFFILYGDPFFLSNWFIIIVAKLLGKKTYLWTHGVNTDLNFKNKLFNFTFYKLCTKILLYGEFAKEKMTKIGFVANKLVVIYNSLDHQKQIIIRNKLTKSNVYEEFFNNNLPIIMYIGRIQKSKKIELIIEAMLIMKNEGNDCNLVIIGKDMEKTGLDNLIQANNLIKNVWLFGPCYNEERIGELIYNADVCVSPGNVGLTAMHSLVYGTPVITHDNFLNQMPEFEAIKSGLTGDFFKENDPVDLSKKIKNWVKLSPAKRKIIRNNSYKIIDEKYNPDYQIKVIKSIYDTKTNF